MKCVKSKIVQKFSEKKLKHGNGHLYKPIATSGTDYQPSDSIYSKADDFKKFKSAVNTTKAGLSDLGSGLKKKFLRLIRLDDCFEDEPALYGFRAKASQKLKPTT
jgi:hypothetical protein